MAPKKNNKKKNAGGNGGADDFDLDALYNEVMNAKETPAQESKPATAKGKKQKAAAKKEDDIFDEAAAFLGLDTDAKSENKPKAQTNEKKVDDESKNDANKKNNNNNKQKKGKGKAEPKLNAVALAAKARLEAIQKAEEERKKKEEEERLKREEEERIRREEEERILQKKLEKKEKKRQKIEKQKAEGTYLTETQKKKLKEARAAIEMMKARGLATQESDLTKEAEEQRRKERQEQKMKEEEEKKKREEEKKRLEEEEKNKEEEVLDDWMDAIDDDDVLAAEEAMNQEEDDEEEESSSSSSSDWENDSDLDDEEKIDIARDKRINKAKENRNMDDLRSPIVVVMGHVDTGKTSLLDKIRKTNVQTGEAGGITQQIGATFLPGDNLKKCTDKNKKYLNVPYKVPGLLVIDTPGHESFSNLRSRGSSMCDIAVLVVDIMHGLENQTIESLNMLLEKKCPFIVALNKIDRMYGWEVHKDNSFRDSFAKQPKYTQEEFENRTKQVITEFMQRGLNASLYWNNDDFKNTVSLVPTSAHTGEGLPDLLGLLIKLSQDHLAKKLAYVDSIQCTVLEKKVDEGLGLTLDVILINGTLHVGDTIVVCGLNGPIVTTIRALLTPEPMRDARVKCSFKKYDQIKAALGIKIAANGLEDAVAGSPLFVCTPEDYLEELKDAVMADLNKFRRLLKRNEEGVYVQASTIGSLEALLEFLNNCKPPIPVAGFNIGPLHRRDVIQASVQLEKKPEYACILAFDVKITPDAAQYAQDEGIRIFTADIIYHLFDQFTEYIEGIQESKKESTRQKAIFPCVLKIIPQYIFNRNNPIVIGVDVVEGVLKPNTPLYVIKKEEQEVIKEEEKEGIMGIDNDPTVITQKKEVIKKAKALFIGTVRTIEMDHKALQEATAGKSVAISIEQKEDQSNIMVGRQFDDDALLTSYISRSSIDALKENFKKEMNDDYWRLVIRIKNQLGIN
ncbi:hypothetical protein WA158_006224 [Blastocystis sp. Blastoise]